MSMSIGAYHPGGASIGSFTPDHAMDNTPDALTFAAQTNRLLSTTITSNAQTVTGIDVVTNWTVTNGTLLINDVDSGASGTFVVNDVIKLRTTSSASHSTLITVTLNVEGSPFSTWDVTTGAGQSGGLVTSLTGSLTGSLIGNLIG